MSVKLFTVRYGHGHSGTGTYTEVNAKVAAYSAVDAVFQVMLGPRNHAESNRPYAYCRPIHCAPYREGDKIDRDVTKES